MTRSQYDGVVKFERHVRCDDECRNATINAQCVFRSIYPSSCLPSARIAACIAIILFHLHPHTILPAPITTPYPQPTAPPATVCSPGFHSATGGQGTFIKLSSDSRVRVGSAQPKRPPPPPASDRPNPNSHLGSEPFPRVAPHNVVLPQRWVWGQRVVSFFDASGSCRTFRRSPDRSHGRLCGVGPGTR